jgi:hypothetical protein
LGWVHSFDNQNWSSTISLGRFSSKIPQIREGEYTGTWGRDLVNFKTLGGENLYQGLETEVKWPSKEFQESFLQVSKILYSSTHLLSRHVDKYLSQVSMSYPKKSLQKLIEGGSHTGTLFHYDTPEHHKNKESVTNWHNDYTAITGIITNFIKKNLKYIFFFLTKLLFLPSILTQRGK